MGLFGLFNKPPDFNKMVEEDDIGGIVKLMVKGLSARTQEEVDWANQARNVFKTRMMNERNAKKLTDIILKKVDDNENDGGEYTQALTMMGKDSLLVEPLIYRLMDIYYFSGNNINQIDLKKFKEQRRHIIFYLSRLKDKRIIEPLLLVLADSELYLAGDITFINTLKKYGDDVRLKLNEIVASSDPNIYLYNLIEHLFQSYTNSKLRDDPSRVEYVIRILNKEHLIIGHRRDSINTLRTQPDNYWTGPMREKLEQQQWQARMELSSEQKDQSETSAGVYSVIKQQRF